MNYKVFISLNCLFFFSLDARSWQAWRKQQRHMKQEGQVSSAKIVQSPETKEKASTLSEVNAISLPEGTILQDRSLALIDGTERRYVICQSECNRTSIQGQSTTLETLTDDELMFQEALRYKIPIDESIADKYISSISRQYNLKPSDVNEIFKHAGLTPEEGRQELMKMYARNIIMDHKIVSRIFVSQQEIEAYAQKNPVYKPAKYQLQIAVVPYSSHVERQKATLIRDIQKGTTNHYQWCEAFWLTAADIADDKQFILSMKPGDCSSPQEAGEGFEIIKLIDKKDEREVPLQKRYKEIVAQLREPKINEEMENYLIDLHKRASITIISQSA